MNEAITEKQAPWKISIKKKSVTQRNGQPWKRVSKTKRKIRTSYDRISKIDNTYTEHDKETKDNIKSIIKIHHGESRFVKYSSRSINHWNKEIREIKNKEINLKIKKKGREGERKKEWRFKFGQST